MPDQNSGGGFATASQRNSRIDLPIGQRQRNWLSACLQRNKQTEIGRRYDFAGIDSPDTYRDVLPIVDYEQLAGDIKRIAAGEVDVLFAGGAVAFERTGGSSGGSKLIPYSAASLSDFRGAISPWLRRLIAGHHLQGSAYWAISPAMRQPQVTPGGIAIGIDESDYVTTELAPAMLEGSAIPDWVGRLYRAQDWKLATAYWLLRRADLSLISVWSPTFMLGLLDAIVGLAEQLATLLTVGGTIAGNAVPADANALGRLQDYLEHQVTQLLWPDLRLVSCWADAASRPYYEQLVSRIPHSQFEPKGLISTESVVTVPDGEGQLLLSADHGFFEFLCDGQSLLANALSEGGEYEVIVTTAGGLYRYRTGDLVRCDGYSNDVPSLSFIGRDSLTSDLVGEKLTESFVVQCLYDIQGFRMLVPELFPEPHYVLVTEHVGEMDSVALADKVETQLRANTQYAYARDIGQLGKLLVHRADNPLDSYMDRASRTQARLGDVKIPALQPEPNWLQTFTLLQH